MFENVDGRRTDAGVTGILIAHLRAFGSGELINLHITLDWSLCLDIYTWIFFFGRPLVLRG